MATESVGEHVPEIDVLLIEDDSEAAAVIRDCLNEMEGVRVDFRHAKRLLEGVARLAEQRPDVVLLDFELPESPGRNALRRIFAQAPNLPVVVLSDERDRDSAIQAIRSGAVDYLVKGEVDTPRLCEALRHAADRTRRRLADPESPVRRGLLDKVPDALDLPFYVIDAGDYTITYANPAAGFVALSGAATCYALMHHRTQPCGPDMPCPLGEVKRTRKPTRVEHIHYDKDGNPRVMEVHACPVLDDAGNVSHALMLAIDISRRKQTEESLRQSEQRFRALVESTSDWIWEVDPKGTYTYSSPKVKDLLGYDPEEVVGRTPFDFMPPEEAKRAVSRIRIIFESRLPIVRLENTNLSKDGRRVVLETSGVPIVGENGDFLGYRGIDRDITDYKEIEKSLAERERRYRRLLRAVTNYTYSVWVKEGAPVSTEHSPGCFPVTGYSPADYEADPYLWISMVHPEDRPTVREYVSRIFASEEMPSIEHRIVHKDGSVRWVRNTIVHHRGEDGELLRYDGVVEDITGRKRAEESLHDRELQLRTAQEIQRHLLPRTDPTLAGFDIAGDLRPAQYAAGDYFDYLPLRDGSLGIAIGDVSGHGFGPALIMATTHVLMGLLTESQTDLAAILTRANSMLIKDIEGSRFVTLLLARLDPRTRSFHYASAGHPNGYVLDASGNVKSVAQSTSIPVAVMLDTEFLTGKPVTLEAGDVVVLVTDGIQESRSPDGALFGTERMVEVVRSNRHRTAREIVEALFAAACDFSGRKTPEDDVTAVVIKVEAPVLL